MKLTVPTSPADITVKTFEAFHLAEGEVAQISALLGIEESVVKRLDVDSLERIMDVLVALERTDAEEYPLVKWTELRGEEYGLHPNLDSLSLGEYIDLETACSDIFSNLPSAMSILYPKVKERHGERYSVHSYDPDRSKEAYQDMTMDVVFGVLAFFLRLGIGFSMSLAHSLEEEKKGTQAPSQLSGDGTRQSTILQGGIFSRLKRLLR